MYCISISIFEELLHIMIMHKLSCFQFFRRLFYIIQSYTYIMYAKCILLNAKLENLNVDTFDKYCE
jgi:hypothetical protein